MSDTHGFSLTLKHREDFEIVAAFVKQQVREKSLELLGEDLSVDGFVGLKIKKEKTRSCGTTLVITENISIFSR